MLRRFVSKSFFRESAWVFTANIISAAISMLTAAILARSLSVESFGIYSLFMTGTSIFLFMALPGMDTIINKAALTDNDAAIWPTLKTSINFSLLGTCILSLAALPLYSYDLTEHAAVSLFLALMLPALALQKFDFVLIGKQAFKQSRLLNVLTALLLLLIPGCLSYTTENITFVLLSIVVVRYLTGSLGWFFASKYITIHSPPKNLKNLYSQGYSQSVLSIFNLGIGYIDRVIIGYIDLEALAVYHIATLIPTRIKEQIKSIVSVPMQTWSGQGKAHFIENLDKHFKKIFLSTAAICSILSIFIPLAIPFIFGPQYTAATPIALIHIWTLLFRICSSFLEHNNMIFDDSHFYQMTVYAKQGLYILLLPLAIWKFGTLGIAANLLLCDFLNYSVQYIVYRKERHRHDHPNTCSTY